jgi:hypothetical protein
MCNNDKFRRARLLLYDKEQRRCSLRAVVQCVGCYAV